MLADCKLIALPKFSDERGSLGFVEHGENLPFPLERIYYLYDVPEGKERGAHGHRELQQLIIALSGNFEVSLDDGHEQKVFKLSDAATGLYVSAMMWRDLRNFSSDAVCLVLASAKFDPDDYLHDYGEFVDEVNSMSSLD